MTHSQLNAVNAIAPEDSWIPSNFGFCAVTEVLAKARTSFDSTKFDSRVMGERSNY
jgi:hypothetical protein